MPWWAEVVLEALVRGPGAEHVRGDIEEHHRTDIAAGVSPTRRTMRLLRQVLGTTVAWWRPGAWAARRGKARRRGRSITGTTWGGEMGRSIQDLRVAVRNLGRRPLLAGGIVVTLGLGVGATAATFSVVDAVLLSPLSYEAADRLVSVGTTFPGREWRDESASLQYLAGTAYLNFRDFRDRARSFSALSAVEITGLMLPDRGSGPERVIAAAVTPDFWRTLAVTPSMGRLFTPDEHVRHAGSQPVVLSHGTWQTRFGGDPGVVGATVELVGGTATVVGVLPSSFEAPEPLYPGRVELWTPFETDHPRYADRSGRSVFIVGRLAPDRTVDEARREMQAIAEDLAAEFPDGNVYPDGSHFGAGVNALKAETVGTSGRLLWIFLAASALLLAIAILNATSLLLARGLDRARELGVRRALGAGTGNIVRLLLTESALLSLVGGLLGVGLAHGAVATLRRFGPGSLPRMGEIGLDGGVLLAVSALVVFAGMLTGIVPALRLGRGGSGSLPSSSRSVAPGQRTHTILVASQVALAVVLLSGAGLLLHTLQQLREMPTGLDPDGLVTFAMGLKRPGDETTEASRQAWDALLDEIRTVPGVGAVAGASNVPFQSPNWAPRVLLPTDADDVWREGIAGYVVTPSYLDVAGTRVTRGRGLADTDGPAGPFVALVNEAFVRTQLAGADPIGVSLRMHEAGDESGERRSVTVVGVVEDAVQTRAEDGFQPAIYVPHTQSSWAYSVHVVVRSERPLDAISGPIRSAAARFNPVVPVSDLATMRARIARTRSDPRFRAILIGTFAVVALLLAAAGLYATLAHAVGRRSRELGIRMALGAARGSVLRMVLGQGIRTAGLGLLVGTLAALAAGRTLAGFLYGVAPWDPLTFAAVTALLLVVASAACLVPARRATTVDPVQVLGAD